MIFRIALILSLLLLTSPATAAEKAFDHTHAAWNSLLAQYITATGAVTKVNYAGWHKNPAALQGYLASLSGVSKQQFTEFNSRQKLAFLINAYNAFTVKLVLDHYPVDSIKDIGSLFKSPWKIEFFTLVGEKRSLDEVEHTLIRKSFAEPRIHFAVNCASVGCPALRAEAYSAGNLDAQLEDAARAFLRDVTRNRVDPKAKRLKISKIFKWYADDFAAASGNVRNFVAPYMTDDPALRGLLKSEATEVDFLDYDWRLNGG